MRLLAVFLITAMSAIIHALGDGLETGQIVFWRSFVALFPILVYMMLRGDFPQALRTSQPGQHLLRGLLGAAAITLFFLSLRHLPVANAQALGYLAPVLTLPMASFFLGEKLRREVVIAALLGFAGVILMLLQALGAPSENAAIGVAAGLGYSILMALLRVHVKKMTQLDRPATIAFYLALFASLTALTTLPFGWNIPDGRKIILLCLTGLLGGAAHIASVEAIARAPVSIIAPFDYSGLIWAAGFDLLLFRHLPGWIALLGMICITSAALLVTLAETTQTRHIRAGQDNAAAEKHRHQASGNRQS